MIVFAMEVKKEKKKVKGGVGMGNNLKMLRERAGMTQAEAAKHIGVGQSAISMWEGGINFPRLGLLTKIAEVYGCEIAEIFSEESA